jgi:hypothetical protein
VWSTSNLATRVYYLSESSTLLKSLALFICHNGRLFALIIIQSRPVVRQSDRKVCFLSRKWRMCLFSLPDASARSLPHARFRVEHKVRRQNTRFRLTTISTVTNGISLSRYFYIPTDVRSVDDGWSGAAMVDG